MDLPTDFQTFLADIRPQESHREDLIKGHTLLRERLRAYEGLKNVFVSDFLQGSYRRSTALRPTAAHRSDVDVVVVTKLHENEFTPARAMDVFKPFLDEHYKGKWRPQGRSFGIELSYVEMDLVITSAPSEQEMGILVADAVTSDDDVDSAKDWRLNDSWVALNARMRLDARERLAKSVAQAEWKVACLRIPDREANLWEDTNPLEQLQWTRTKNRDTNGHFVNVVKALKWWKLEKVEQPKHPRGFPLERLIGEHCPTGIPSVAHGITATLEAIVAAYQWMTLTGGKPKLPDYGVPGHDVFARITASDFAATYKQIQAAAKLARRALDAEDRTESGNLWRELLGDKFPKPPETSGQRRFTPPTEPAAPTTSGRFA